MHVSGGSIRGSYKSCIMELETTGKNESHGQERYQKKKTNSAAWITWTRRWQHWGSIIRFGARMFHKLRNLIVEDIFCWRYGVIRPVFKWRDNSFWDTRVSPNVKFPQIKWIFLGKKGYSSIPGGKNRGIFGLNYYPRIFHQGILVYSRINLQNIL